MASPVMLESFARLKPGAPRHIHLCLAALTWTAVGTGLVIAGVRWSRPGPGQPWPIVLAVIVGGLKAWIVLRPASRRVITRIEARGDGRCVGGFFSWRTWLVVACMSVGGRLLRLAGLPAPVVGFIYVAVGTALLIGSTWLWQGWWRHVHDVAA